MDVDIKLSRMAQVRLTGVKSSSARLYVNRSTCCAAKQAANQVGRIPTLKVVFVNKFRNKNRTKNINNNINVRNIFKILLFLQTGIIE